MKKSNNKYERMFQDKFQKSQNSDQGTVFLASLGLGTIFGIAINVLKKRAFVRGAEASVDVAREMYMDELDNK